MTQDAPERTGSGKGDAAFLWSLCLALTLFVMTRAYRGINGDALIYVTRELARRDPQGLGRDAMFLADTQTGYTIFTPLLSALLDLSSPAVAAMTLASAALLLWFGAAAFLSRTIAQALASQLPSDVARTTFALLVFLATFPLSYGAFDVLSAAEAMAVPRPFAEACVLAGLAFLLRNNIAAATASGLLGVLFHPIMGLAGLAVGFAYLALRKPLLWWLVPAGVAALGVAALAGLPLAGQLLTPLDAEWRAVLEQRTAYLFPSLWPAAHGMSLVVQAMTLLLCARLIVGPVRLLLLAALLAGGAGQAFAWIAGDLWPSVLVVQLQPWRAIWVAAVLSPAAFAMLGLLLWPRGAPERASLACLALAWILRDSWTLALPALVAATCLNMEAERLRPRMSAIWTPILFAFVALAAMAWLVLPLAALWRAGLAAGADFEFERAYLWSVNPLALPAGALVIWMALARRRWPAMTLIAPTLVFAAVAIMIIDDRTRLQKALESRDPPPSLVAGLPRAPGELLWIGGGKETWYWAGRANWAAAIQGSSLVFSRPFAMHWRERAESLVALGLEPEKLLQPWTAGPERDVSHINAQSALDAICARSDAPIAIVKPLSEGDLARPDAIVVALPHPAFTLQTSAQGLEWKRTTRYAVHSCADAARPAR